MDVRGLEDCFYFLKGACTNTSCIFRHSTTSKASNVYCQGWQQFTCYDIKCPYRHTAIPVHKPKIYSSYNARHQSTTDTHAPVSEATINFAPLEPHSLDTMPSFLVDTGHRKNETVRAICKYRLHGKCTKGDSCSFLHSSTQSQSEEYLTMPQPTVSSTSSSSSSSSALSAVEIPPASDSASVPVPASASSTSSDVATGGGGKRKGRDILDRYSFRKTIKLDEKKTTEPKTPSSDQA